MPRFTQNTHVNVNALRAALIDDDLDDLTLDQIDEIVTACWADFEPIARRYLAARYANDGDVWDEAESRGYFTADHDD
jgi:hypothetical protein